MPEFHSNLGPSSAHRWLSCPGSVRLERGLPSTTSDYAREGTLAHSFCEVLLNKAFDLTQHDQESQLTQLRKHDLYDPEMERCAQAYVSFIQDIVRGHIGQTPIIYAEHLVNYADVAPSGFGTSDCIIGFPGEIHVVDFKYGKGVSVSAEDNPQMKLYGYGALRELDFLFDAETVHMHIFQPRIDNFSSWQIRADMLRHWARKEVRLAAELTREEHAPFNPGSKQCRWCKAKNLCRARADWMSAGTGSDPALLTSKEIARLLPKAKELESWAKELAGEAQHRLEHGEELPGYKLVVGRQGARRFTDMDAAFERAKQVGVDEAMLYSRVPISLAELERVMGKSDFDMACGDLITRPEGKPTLVPESDKRPAYNPVAAAFGLEL
ncbi:MAG: DUF2800 domain-containing protein [Eubacteriales bacterium]|nr:DUF2800 domain-containing protein [Eubacteriales bacterium]